MEEVELQTHQLQSGGQLVILLGHKLRELVQGVQRLNEFHNLAVAFLPVSVCLDEGFQA